MRKIIAVGLTVFGLFGLLGAVPVQAAVSVSAQGAVLLNADTGEVLFEQNAEQRLPMASTTKIMTALLMAEQPDLSKTVQCTKEMVTVEGSSMGLLPGDTVSYHDLLYGMLLASGNDAANTTAYVLGGSVSGFVRMMNQRAAALGLKNTSFVTPSGLDDENHYTTAHELGLLAAAALKNNAFRAACSSRTATLYYGNPPYRRSLTNHNRLLNSYPGMIGVKTGFTKRSGRCLVTAAERDGVRVIAVTLNDPNDWDDHRTMLDYGFTRVERVCFDHYDVPQTLPVISGDCDAFRIYAEPITFGICKENIDKITRKVVLPAFTYSTVAAGERVGYVNYYLDSRPIARAEILSMADVELYNRKKNYKTRFLRNLNLLFSCI